MNRESDPSDRERYQTVYARHEGAIAAPTAGLHFTPELLASVPTISNPARGGRNIPSRQGGQDRRPSDAYGAFFLPEAAARAVNNARRVIAVGTTSVRVLEHVATAEGLPLRECSGSTNIFIYPPYNYKVVDALITNFHLPQSTLLMLVSAFAGRELVMKAYLEAIRERYRFFSYGDCMLIL